VDGVRRAACGYSACLVRWFCACDRCGLVEQDSSWLGTPPARPRPGLCRAAPLWLWLHGFACVADVWGWFSASLVPI